MSSQYNRFGFLNSRIMHVNLSDLEKLKKYLREIIVNIRLERINTQEGVPVEILLDSTTGLIMSSEFSRKQRFKLKKIKRPIYIRNIDSTFNKERLIEYTVEVNIFYKGHREITEINVIGE